MLKSYLEQLDETAARLDIRLEDACEAEGIAATTLARWRKGEASPREGTARAILDRLNSMANGEAAA